MIPEPMPCNGSDGLRARGQTCALEHGHTPPCYAESALAKSLHPFRAPRLCRFCGRKIQDGYTVTGKPSVFEVDPPHVNHWITCRQAAAARKAYPR